MTLCSLRTEILSASSSQAKPDAILRRRTVVGAKNMKSLAIIPLLLTLSVAGCSKPPRQTVRTAEQSVRSAARNVQNKAAIALHSATGPKRAGEIAEQKPSAAIVAKSHRRRR